MALQLTHLETPQLSMKHAYSQYTSGVNIATTNQRRAQTIHWCCLDYLPRERVGLFSASSSSPLSFIDCIWRSRAASALARAQLHVFPPSQGEVSPSSWPSSSSTQQTPLEPWHLLRLPSSAPLQPPFGLLSSSRQPWPCASACRSPLPSSPPHLLHLLLLRHVLLRLSLVTLVHAALERRNVGGALTNRWEGTGHGT
jgi:hypothetical protein